MMNTYKSKFRAGVMVLLMSLVVPVCGFSADWNWIDTTVPASNKTGHSDRNWSTAENWGSNSSPNIGTSAALSDSYAFNQDISRWQWIKLPAVSTSPYLSYLGTLTGGFHNTIVLTSYTKQSERLYTVANPNGFEGDWMIEGASDGVGVKSGFMLPATAAFTPVLQRVNIAGGMQFKVATGGTAELRYPFGEGAVGVNKSVDNLDETAGTLAITRSPGPRGELRVYAGEVALTGRTYADGASFVPGAALHLDASKTETLTTNSEGFVTEWRDADGGARFASPSGTRTAPKVRADYVNGLSVVDFGAQYYDNTHTFGDPAVLGDPSRLMLDEAVSGIREFFVVFADTTPTNRGAAFVNVDTYARADSVGSLFGNNQTRLSDKTAFAAIETADISLDAQAVPHTVSDVNFARGLHVVGVGHRGNYTGTISVLGAPNASNAPCGGTRVAEILAYTKALTPDERRQNVAYLRRKWQVANDVADLDYGVLSVEGEATVSVADGTTVEVGELKVASGVSKLVKTGGGTLVIDSYLTPSVPVEVRGGSVKFATSGETMGPTKAADPLVWLDANTLTGESGSEVAVWADARGAEAPAISAGLDSAGTYSAATLDATTVSGKKMVDMGATFSKESPSTYFLITDNGATIGKSVRCGFMVYYKNVAGAVVPSSADASLRVIDGTSKFIDGTWGNAYAVGGLWSLDGQPIDPTSCRALGGNTVGEVHIIAFRFPSPQSVNVLGADRSGSNNNHGGIKFGEVLLYDRVLSERECKDTEAYLLNKWKGVRHPADIANEQAVDLTLADGAVLRTDISTLPSGKFVVNGTLALTGSGTVIADVPAGWRIVPGDYVIAEASGGITCSDISAWTVTSSSGVEGRLRLVDGTQLVLTVPRNGFIITFR